MAAVAAWVILFGLLPFFAFALLVQRGTASGSPPAAWEGFVLNLIPFALLAAPLVGFFEGARALSPARRRSRAPRGPS